MIYRLINSILGYICSFCEGDDRDPKLWIITQPAVIACTLYLFLFIFFLFFGWGNLICFLNFKFLYESQFFEMRICNISLCLFFPYLFLFFFPSDCIIEACFIYIYIFELIDNFL